MGRTNRVLQVGLVAALFVAACPLFVPSAAAFIPPLPIGTWVVDSLPIPSRDVAYDASRDVVLATVGSSDASLGNELVELDPETGVVGRHVHVGSEPATIAVTDDGSTAYVGLEGASSIAVVDLDDFSATSFPIENSDDGPRFAVDLEVIPGRNDIVVASLSRGPMALGGSVAVVAYEDGVALPQQFESWDAPDRLVTTSATTLFGYESQTSANVQVRLTLGAQGLTSTPVPSGPVVGAAADIEFGFGRIYSTYGDIIDPTTLAVTAEVAASGLVEVTADNRLTVVSGGTVSVFNATTGAAVTSGTVPGLGAAHELVATATGFALAAPGETYLLGPSVAVGAVGLPAAPPRTMVEATTAHLPFRVNDMVLDEARGRLYASIAGSSAQHENEVVALDPATGTVLASVPVLEPGALALSDDGTRLHVASALPRAILTIDPATFGVLRSFVLGNHFFFGNLRAGDIAVAPGTNDTLVVAQVPVDPSGWTASFAVFVGGVLQPSVANGEATSFRLAFVDGDDLVAAGSESNRMLRRLHLDADGVHIVDDTKSMFQNSVGDLEVVDGLVYSASGSVVDPTAPAVRGTYSNAQLTAVSDAPDRVLDVSTGLEGLRVTEYERSTFRRLGDLVLPVSGFARRSVSIPGGLAVALDAGSLLLVRHAVPAQLRTVAPARLADTRSGFGAPGGPLTAASVRNVQVTGRGGVPATGVSAVVVNLTAVGATAAGHLTAWPAGHVRPSTSNVNLQAGSVVANQAIVPVGEGGRISLAVAGGSVHVVVDVQGWFGPSGSPAGSRLHTVAPARLADSRSGLGTPAGPFSAGVVRHLTVTGRGGVPASGVGAVVVNLTAVGASAQGHLTAWPTGQAQPTTSNVNFRPGVVVANQAIVPVGSGGRISIVAAASTHVVVDVQGWYGPAGASTGAELRTSTPARIMDSRTGMGTPTGPFAAGATRHLVVAGRGGVPSSGVSAVVVNLTVVGATSQGHLTAWPTGQAKPSTSNVNFRPGAVVANQAVVPVGSDGRISIAIAAGTAHVIVDVQGWFGPTG